MDKISDLETNSHLYQYQKDLKTRIVQERGDKLKIKQDLEKEKTKQEVREDTSSSVVALVAQPKDKGKHVLEGSSSCCISTMEDTLQKGAELKIQKIEAGSK